MILRLPNLILRSYRIVRLYSALAINPSLKKNPFTDRPLPTNLLELPLNTYPNPLLTLNKEELLNLKDKELHHLLSIPGGSPVELEQLFLNVVLIINDTLISDTQKAAFFLETFEKSVFELPVSAFLKESYKGNRVRKSIVSFLDDPNDEEARADVMTVLEEMARRLNDDPKDSALMIYNYLHKLSALRSVNLRKIFLPPIVLELLIHHLSELEKRNLFSYLVICNMKFYKGEHYSSLHSTLLQSGPLSKLVARTGLKDPKWHHTAYCDFNDLQREQMTRFFSFNELKSFAGKALLEKNFLESNLYLELIVTKFEQSSNSRYLQDVLELMLVHSMILKGPQECIRFLRYNVESGLEIKTGTLLKVLEKLREESLFDEALFLINFLHKEYLEPSQRKKLVSEIMQVMQKKFVDHPQIVVGYLAALFNDESKSVLRMLQDLKLLDLLYGDGSQKVSHDVIKEAVVHEDLKGSKLSHGILSRIYSLTLRNIDLKDSCNPTFIMGLYEPYISHVKDAMDKSNNTSIFHEKNIDESVISLFMEYLLRSKPHDPDSMELSPQKLNYDTAKFIASDFFNTVNVRWTGKKTYLIDLLIYSSILQHNDVAFGLQMLKRAREANLPVTFNQIYPFISYHLSRKENDKALGWYQIMVENGVKARSITATKLFKTAKELNWPVKGSQYKSSITQRNKEIRKKLQLAASDPVSLLPSGNSSTLSHRLFDFIEELAAVLNPIAGGQHKQKTSAKPPTST